MSQENVGDIEPEPSKSSETVDTLNSSSSSIEIEYCPPTPEHIPPGSKTPPPASSSSRRKDYKKSSKRRTKSLDGGPSSPDGEQLCPICLGELDNKSMTDTCRHKFCFTCLLEWSKVKAVCPLCKGKFTAIIHNMRSETEYDKYDIPPPQPAAEGNSRLLESDLLWTRRFRYHTTAREHRRRVLGDRAGPQDIVRLADHWRRRRGPGTSDFRRVVYESDLWAQPSGAGRSRECSPEWYRNNEAQTHRLVPWLNRELNALLGLTGQHSRQAHLLSQIMDWITVYTIGSPDLSERLLPHLGTNTEHFQHELLQFARSPYDLTGYDRNVRYEGRRIRTEVVSSDSEEDDTRLDMMAEIRSRMEQLDRFMADRAPPFNLGVTNFPDRSGREVAVPQREEIRRGLSERPRSAERRRGDRDLRREMGRLREIRSRREQERETRRRKNKKPSKYQRQVPLSFMSEDVDDADDAEGVDDAEEAMDLSTGGGAVSLESQPSTSRGHSSGLDRLIIPDSDSESGDERLVVDDHEEENVTGIVRDIISDVLTAVVRSRPTDIEEIEPRQETFTAQQLGNFVQSQMTQLSQMEQYPPFMLHSGYYSAPYNPGYLSELTGMISGDMMAGAGPSAQQDGDNSDLEVVDVISAKPTRKAKDPEVVELSDSDSESEPEEERVGSSSSQNHPSTAPQAAQGDDVIYIISSDEEIEGAQQTGDHGYSAGSMVPNYMRMSLISQTSYDPQRGQGTWKSTKKAESPVESSDDDDLIVVKTEHNTIDPITKKQIVEPVKNKKCNHIYEKSTIYSMIDLARENSKPVKCPYMGCNCRDFKKTDLVKDKEVLGHIHSMNEEQVKADRERKERDRRAAEKRKKNKSGGGYASDVSITIDGDDDDDAQNPNLTEFELPGIEAPNLSESSSDETNVAKTSKTTLSISQSSDNYPESNSPRKIIQDSETEKTKKSSSSNAAQSSHKVRKKKRTHERLSVSSNSDTSDSSDSSDVALPRAGRVRKPPRKLNDSYAGSDLEGSENETRKKGKKKGKTPKSPKKLKIVKKVTQTWCYDNVNSALKKGKKRRKKREDSEDENSQDESEYEAETTEIKGKSSKSKPPKNSSFSRNRPKRAKKVSYQEFDEDF